MLSTEPGRAEASAENRLSNTVLRAMPWLFEEQVGLFEDALLLLASDRPPRWKAAGVGISGSFAGGLALFRQRPPEGEPVRGVRQVLRENGRL